MIFFDWVYIILGVVLIPGIIFASVAQGKVSSTYRKYSKVFSTKNIPASVMARNVLDAAGLQNVKIIKVKGELTDHYNSKEKVLALSEDNYNSSSLAALGVAAHEIGHALQDKHNYKAFKTRNALGKASNIGAGLLIPCIILAVVLGLFMPMSSNWLPTTIMVAGTAFFGFSVIFNLITLPVEYNASKRTEEILVTTGLLEPNEYEGVKKVLNAAALTYVAAMLISLLSLLRFVLWFVIVFGKKD